MPKVNRSIRDFFRPVSDGNPASDRSSFIEPHKRRRVWISPLENDCTNRQRSASRLISSPSPQEGSGSNGAVDKTPRQSAVHTNTPELPSSVNSVTQDTIRQSTEAAETRTVARVRSPTPAHLPSAATASPKPTGAPVIPRVSHTPPSRSLPDGESTPAVQPTSASPPTSVPGLTHITSRRTISSGETIVKDSDSDVSGSESELEDISAVLKRFREEKEEARGVRDNSTQVVLSQRRLKESNRLAEKKSRKFKFSLSELVRVSERNQEEEEKLSAIRAEAEEGNASIQDATPESVIREALKAAANVNADDSDEARADVERVMEAMKKTDSLQDSLAWRMLSTEPTPPSLPIFPSRSTPSHGWMAMLGDNAKRQSAFLSGFMTRAASHSRLPTDVVSWLIMASCLEKRDDLASAYFDTLIASLMSFEREITTTDVQKLFRCLGCVETALDTNAAIVPAREPVQSPATKSPTNLCCLLDMSNMIAVYLTSQARAEAMKLMVRLSLDSDLYTRGAYVVAMSDALLTLVESIPAGEVETATHEFALGIFTTIESPILRWQLISHFPRTTDRTYTLRRRLALGFALDSPKHLRADLTNHAYNARLIVHLQKHPIYRSGPRNDLRTLAAYISLLGAAVDCGFSDFSFVEASQQNDATARAKEREFNVAIDMLTSLIRDVASRIRVTSASNMRGAEVKAAAERLAQKLESGVRTRPKPRKDWFGGEDPVDAHHGAELMSRWTKAGRLAAADAIAPNKRVKTETADAKQAAAADQDSAADIDAVTPPGDDA